MSRKEYRFTRWLVWCAVLGPTSTFAQNFNPVVIGQSLTTEVNNGSVTDAQFQQLQDRAIEAFLAQPETEAYFETNFKPDGDFGELRNGNVLGHPDTSSFSAAQWEAFAKAMGTTGTVLVGAYALWRQRRREQLARIAQGDTHAIENLIADEFLETGKDGSSSVKAMPTGARDWEEIGVKHGLAGLGIALMPLAHIWKRKQEAKDSLIHKHTFEANFFRAAWEKSNKSWRGTTSNPGFSDVLNQKFAALIEEKNEEALDEAGLDAPTPLAPFLDQFDFDETYTAQTASGSSVNKAKDIIARHVATRPQSPQAKLQFLLKTVIPANEEIQLAMYYSKSKLREPTPTNKATDSYSLLFEFFTRYAFNLGYRGRYHPSYIANWARQKSYRYLGQIKRPAHIDAAFKAYSLEKSTYLNAKKAHDIQVNKIKGQVFEQYRHLRQVAANQHFSEYYNLHRDQESWQTYTSKLLDGAVKLKTEQTQSKTDALNADWRKLASLFAQSDASDISIDQAPASLKSILAFLTEKDHPYAKRSKNVLAQLADTADPETAAPLLEELTSYRAWLLGDPTDLEATSKTNLQAARAYQEGLMRDDEVAAFVAYEAERKAFFLKYADSDGMAYLERMTSGLKAEIKTLEARLQPGMHWYYASPIRQEIAAKKKLLAIYEAGKLPDISQRSKYRSSTLHEIETRQDGEVDALRFKLKEHDLMFGTNNPSVRKNLVDELAAKEAALFAAREAEWDAFHAKDLSELFSKEQVAAYEALKTKTETVQDKATVLEAVVAQFETLKAKAAPISSSFKNFPVIITDIKRDELVTQEAVRTVEIHRVREVSIALSTGFDSEAGDTAAPTSSNLVLEPSLRPILTAAFNSAYEDPSQFVVEAERMLKQQQVRDLREHVEKLGIPAAPVMTATVRNLKEDKNDTIARTAKEIQAIKDGIPILKQKFAHNPGYLETALKQADKKITALQDYIRNGEAEVAKYDENLAAYASRYADRLAEAEKEVAHKYAPYTSNVLAAYYSTVKAMVEDKKTEIIDTRQDVQLVEQYLGNPAPVEEFEEELVVARELMASASLDLSQAAQVSPDPNKSKFETWIDEQLALQKANQASSALAKTEANNSAQTSELINDELTAATRVKLFADALSESLSDVFPGETTGAGLQAFLINRGLSKDVSALQSRLAAKYPEQADIIAALSVDDLLVAYPETKAILVDLGLIAFDVAGGAITKVAGRAVSPLKVPQVAKSVWLKAKGFSNAVLQEAKVLADEAFETAALALNKAKTELDGLIARGVDSLDDIARVGDDLMRQLGLIPEFAPANGILAGIRRDHPNSYIDDFGKHLNSLFKDKSDKAKELSEAVVQRFAKLKPGSSVPDLPAGTTSFDINLIRTTQPESYLGSIHSLIEKIKIDGPTSVPRIQVYIHNTDKGPQAMIVDGHHRLQAFRTLGYERVPVQYVSKSDLHKFTTSVDDLLDRNFLYSY